MPAQHPVPVPVCKTVNRLSKVRELFPGKFQPIRHRVGMEWIADFNPGATTSAPSAAILRVMNPEIHQILDELGMTLLAADLIQMLHQSTARFTDFRFPP
jgi:hypothetical protein